MASVTLALFALLTATPATPAARPSAEEVLRVQCRTWAADPKNPWALAHGIALDGRAFKARDGRPAANVILSDFLRREGTGPDMDLRFDTFAPDGTPVEPHPNLLVKTLLLAGYAPSQSFQASGGPVTLGALVEDLKRDFRRESALSPHGAWTLDALSQALPPGATFTNGAGETIHLDAVMDEALALLEHEQAELLAGMKAGLPQVPKRKQGIYAHPCGGLHLFQAVASHARHAAVRKAWGARLDAQVDVLFYRLGSESRQYDAALTSAPPAYRLPVLVQMVKFYGHFLETLGRYREETGWKPTPEQRQSVEQARALLDGAVRRLEAAGAYRDMESLKATQYQLYLDLIGDSCHAAHGWSYWRKYLGG
ncbi:hypothetical protein [Vitiosangium sp. GDMCC 1.1324]|uniref:hypothetical protein n=1 Tax=Vitiosangium sp. (strain GDMCC 1.1324) TaxID=2138576 RepID=UPI000D36A644|nr:hypothetical protein [Vitiosangium sp. GDMCC 1.1324]PTL78234.1 hypothetical protein DAT35_39965 [Vitiosangium sp. GDMCC 1.1324]